MIMYGTVDGASTQPAAMSKILRIVHENCGDKPQIGKVFQFKGTNTVGVFFTVVNHPEGDKRVAGLVIAAASGPHQVEAALLSDDATRFGKSINPMLQQLLGVWHPGGGAASTPAGAGSARPSGGTSVGPAQLHTVTLPDRSASVGLPDGWKVDPGSGGGTIVINGPHGEKAGLNMAQSGLDTTDPTVRSLARYGSLANNQGRIVYPFNVDLTRAYPEILKRWRHNNGNDAPVDLQNTHAERMPTQRGEQCVHVTGDVVYDDKHNEEMSMILCTRNYQQGYYSVLIFQSLIPVDLADRERATAGAIMASFQMNQAVVQQQANAIAAPTIAAIQNIGRQAAADSAARNAANDAQHAGYWAQQNSNAAQHSAWNAGQDDNARTGQGFSNYLLDQTVVQDNNMYGNGTVGHGTVWNSTADALVKADPNRFESVDTPNYWKGTDF